MSIRYIYHCSKEHLSSFTKLLFRWRGSLYKLLWKEILIFLCLYYFLTLIHIFALTLEQKEQLRQLSIYLSNRSTLIPITFIMGAFVSFAVTDRWQQYFRLLPFPDRALIQISAFVDGDEIQDRMLRRTMARYLNLSTAFILNEVSLAFKKRFPKRLNLIPFLITEKELMHISSVEVKYSKKPLDCYSLPIHWACSLLHQARQDGRIDSDAKHIEMHREFMAYRGNLGSLSCLDWITIPLIYVQVVTIALYTFLLTTLLARPFDRYPASGIDNLETYFPLFALVRFVFYMGWLKVAETLFNPYGEDDDDYEINYIADRNLQISYALVDDFHDKLPELEKDPMWDRRSAVQAPYYTQASKDMKTRMQCGSAEKIRIPTSQQIVIEDPETFKQLPQSLKRQSISVIRQKSKLSADSCISPKAEVGLESIESKTSMVEPVSQPRRHTLKKLSTTTTASCPQSMQRSKLSSKLRNKSIRSVSD